MKGLTDAKGALAELQEPSAEYSTGTIERISEEETDNGVKVRVNVRHGKKPKRNKSGAPVSSYPLSSDVCITPEQAAKLSVGQRVHVSVEPVSANEV